jgi:UDP:flavonoid glycosyltransferase YjiC (YdhE family)
MARIVIFCWGSHGDVDPALGLAGGLRARGHSVGIATLEYFRTLVGQAGCDYFPLRPHADPSDTATVRRIMDARRGPENLLKEIVFPAVRDQYADVEAAAAGADLLISHPLSIAVPIYAERHGVPWANMVLAPTSFFSPTDMPVLPPAPWLKRLEVLGQWLPRFLVAGGKATTHRWAHEVTAFRRELGLSDGLVPLFDGQHSPHLVLALYSRVLGEPQPDWPPHTVLTGNMFHDVVHGASLGAELADFLTAGEPPIVFTLGSSAVLSPGTFWEESAAAVRTLGVRAVFLVGPGNAPAMRATLPPSILAVERAPHSLLFPHASAIVQQCGAGTMGQVLRSGRPTLAVPFSHDQPDNAFRAARLGVARIIPAQRYRRDRVARDLATLLADPAYANAASAVATRVRGERGIDAACEAIAERFPALT